jgi:hypothetical protein
MTKGVDEAAGEGDTARWRYPVAARLIGISVDIPMESVTVVRSRM